MVHLVDGAVLPLEQGFIQLHPLSVVGPAHHGHHGVHFLFAQGPPILGHEDALDHAAGRGPGASGGGSGGLRGHVVCRRLQRFRGVHRHPAHGARGPHQPLLLLDHMGHLMGQVLLLPRAHEDLVAFGIGQGSDLSGPGGVVVYLHIRQAQARSVLQRPAQAVLGAVVFRASVVGLPGPLHLYDPRPGNDAGGPGLDRRPEIGVGGVALSQHGCPGGVADVPVLAPPVRRRAGADLFLFPCSVRLVHRFILRGAETARAFFCRL